jgi:hypothetical protein
MIMTIAILRGPHLRRRPCILAGDDRKGWAPVEATTSHGLPGGVPSVAVTDKPSGPWFAARLAVVALVLWVVIDVIRTTLAVGHYEDRITVGTHGDPDVWPAWMAYELLVNLMPRATVTAMADRLWILGALAAAVAFITWLYQTRRNAGRLGGTLEWTPGWAVGGWFIPVASLVIPYLVVRDVRRASAPAPQPVQVGWWWTSVLVTVLLNQLIWLYGVVTSDGGRFEGAALDTRIVAYPLWTVGTVMIAATAFLSARVIRRITQAQQRIVDAGATGPE